MVERANIILENGDVKFIKSLGYSVSGFCRFKISELKKVESSRQTLNQIDSPNALTKRKSKCH